MLAAYDPVEKRADGTPNLKSENKRKPDEIAQLGAVKVKRMLLKDNDCGIAKQNRAKKAGLSKKIAHLDPETYQRLLAFDAVADQPEARKFFTQGLMFKAADYTKVRKNLKELASELRARCDAGKLKLDLDLDRFFSGLPLEKASCESRG